MFLYLLDNITLAILYLYYYLYILSRLISHGWVVISRFNLTILSSALAALPQLTELCLCFYETIEMNQEWLESYLALT
jgi:hypothetical protein